MTAVFHNGFGGGCVVHTDDDDCDDCHDCDKDCDDDDDYNNCGRRNRRNRGCWPYYGNSYSCSGYSYPYYGYGGYYGYPYSTYGGCGGYGCGYP